MVGNFWRNIFHRGASTARFCSSKHTSCSSKSTCCRKQSMMSSKDTPRAFCLRTALITMVLKMQWFFWQLQVNNILVIKIPSQLYQVTDCGKWRCHISPLELSNAWFILQEETSTSAVPQKKPLSLSGVNGWTRESYFNGSRGKNLKSIHQWVAGQPPSAIKSHASL